MRSRSGAIFALMLLTAMAAAVSARAQDSAKPDAAKQDAVKEAAPSAAQNAAPDAAQYGPDVLCVQTFACHRRRVNGAAAADRRNRGGRR